MNAAVNSDYNQVIARFEARNVDAISTAPVANPAYTSAGYSPAIGNFNPVLGSANADLEPAREIITSRSIYERNNNPIAKAIIDRIMTNAVGTQLKLQPKINHKYLKISKDEADDISEKLEIEWDLFSSKELDESRRFNFIQICGQLMANMLIGGDVFATTPMKKRKNSFNPYQTCVKMIESSRVSNPYNASDTPERTGGIQLKDNELYSIWVTEQHLGDSYITKYGWKEVPFFGAKTGRRRVMHLINPNMWRPEQMRGVSYLSIVQTALKKLQNWTESELTRANVQSNMGGAFIELADDFGGRPLFGEKNINPLEGAEQRVGFYADNRLRMGEGSILTLLPNDKVTFPPVSAPNAHFESFHQAILNEAGAATIPASVIMQVFKSSYSAARAELNEAWTTYLWLRQWLVWDFAQPLYQLFLDEAVALGRLKLKGYFSDPAVQLAWSGVEFIAPKQRHIDEQKAAGAAQKRIEAGISSQRHETEANGQDFDAVTEQRRRERQQEAEFQKEINPQPMQPAQPEQAEADQFIDDQTDEALTLDDLREAADASGYTSISAYLEDHEEINLL